MIKIPDLSEMLDLNNIVDMTEFSCFQNEYDSSSEKYILKSVPPAQPVVCTPGNNPLLPAGADGASNATAFCTSFTGRC